MEDLVTPEEIRVLIAEALSAKLGRIIDPAAVTFQVEAHMEVVDAYERTAPRGEFKGIKIET